MTLTCRDCGATVKQPDDGRVWRLCFACEQHDRYLASLEPLEPDPDYYPSLPQEDTPW